MKYFKCNGYLFYILNTNELNNLTNDFTVKSLIYLDSNGLKVHQLDTYIAYKTYA